MARPPLHPPSAATPYHALAIPEAAHALEASLENGLTASEAALRLARYGPNTTRHLRTPPFWAPVVRQFQNILTLILLVAVGIALALGDQMDALVILAIVVGNVALGTIQEVRAERAMQALQRLAAPAARVRRNGRSLTTPAAEVVPGDLVELESGDLAPADLRLVETQDLEMDEAPLTGESLPVAKDALLLLSPDTPVAERANMAFQSTAVVAGRGVGLVAATGYSTQVGRIAVGLAATTERPTPLQRQVDQLARVLVALALAACCAVFAAGLLRAIPLGEMFWVAISLAVAAVPEGLPAAVTVVLALGVQRMARRNAIVRRLVAIEALGAATVICSDKTGTLTQGTMAVAEVLLPEGHYHFTGLALVPEGAASPADQVAGPLQQLFLASVLCNNAILVSGEPRGTPTEIALLDAALRYDPQVLANGADHRRLRELPFSSQRKFMSTLYRRPDGTLVLLIKGAPEALLPRCAQQLRNAGPEALSVALRDAALQRAETMASRGLRLLAVAYREVTGADADLPWDALEQDLVWLGLLGLRDPLRPDSREAVAACRLAGIRPIMITGDHGATARAMAQELGILQAGGRLLSGPELDMLSDTALTQSAASVAVYYRVTPEHKQRIVTALQQQGHVVAMTGDGVNDAPALRQADIGVAMGRRGTDLARESAALVLADDRFATIVAAVEEGRVIASNLRKTVVYLVAGNTGEILIILLSILAGWPLPLLATQILWVNLVTDGMPALALTVARPEGAVMQQPPRPPGQPILHGQMIPLWATASALLTITTLLAFAMGLAAYPDDLARARTLGFATLLVGQMALALAFGAEYAPAVSRLALSTPLLWSVVAGLGLTVAVVSAPALNEAFHTAPLSIGEWGLAALLAAVPFLGVELLKLLRRRWEGQLAR